MGILCRIIWSNALIPIALATEPHDFDRKVRSPGAAFLKTTPQPTTPQWRGNDYWRKALGDLFKAYNGICAYCACWTFRATRDSRPQDGTIDHFVPKSAVPSQAYEWNNYRLSRRRLNMRKADHRDVLDPFTITPGAFKLDFRTFLLVPNLALTSADSARVVATIDRLELNSDRDYVNERIAAIRQYCTGKVTLVQLGMRYPFIAVEMQNQDFDTNFLPRMQAYFSRN